MQLLMLTTNSVIVLFVIEPDALYYKTTVNLARNHSNNVRMLLT